MTADPQAGREGSPVWLVARVGLLLVAFLGAERWAVGIATLPPLAYERPFLWIEIAKSLVVWPEGRLPGLIRLAGFAGLAYAAIRHRRELLAPWREVEEGDVLRWVIAAPVVLLAWAHATYDVNLFFGQSHVVDRLLLIALAASALWRPVFLLPFAVLVTSIAGQFNYPIGGYSVAEQFLLVRVLLLAKTYFLLRTVGVRLAPSDLVLVIFAALASHYFVPGLGKLRMGWFTSGAVPLLLPATHLTGWLGFLSVETIGQLTSRFLTVDPMFVIGAFFVEACALFALVRRRLLLVYLPLWSFFHLTVFAFSGIFFWKWIVFELSMFVLVVTRSDRPALALFTPAHAVLSVLLIGSGAFWSRPVDLSWYNSAVNYAYRFEAVTETGDSVRLPPRFFAPYDYQFTMTNFPYLSSQRQLTIAWGAVFERSVADALLAAESPRDVAAIEETLGRIAYDPVRAEALDGFLLRFVANWNDRPSERTPLSILAAPGQLWAFAPGGAFDFDERIERIIIHQVTSFFDGARIHHMNQTQVRSLDIR